MMKRSEMVLAGAERLFQTEEAVDRALTETGEMLAALLRMRMAGGLSAVMGQEAVEGIISSATALAQARREIITVHGHLNEVKTQMGCATVAIGTGNDKPIKGSAEQNLQATGALNRQTAL